MKSQYLKINDAIFDLIKASRKAKRIKQKTIADALFMSECNYSKIEKVHKDLTVKQLERISEILDIDITLMVWLAKNFNDSEMTIEEILASLHKSFASQINNVNVPELVQTLAVLHEGGDK